MSKMFLEDFYDSKLFKFALFILFSIGSIILFPIAIVLSPFIFAWSLTKALTNKKKRKAEYNLFDNGNKINDLVFEFDNWFNTGKGND